MNQLFINTRLRVQKDIVTLVQRRLPEGISKIYVVVGQEIGPSDVIGEGTSPVGFRTIHLAKDLEVNPKKALSYLRRSIGQTIYQGELLAVKERLLGLNKKVLLSPVDGVIDYYDEIKGELRIRLLSKIIKLVSGVYGIVEQIDKAACVLTIRTAASIIFGLMGSGKEREGTMKILGSPEMLVSSPQIKENMRGLILVGGSVIFLEALEAAVNLGICGIISGGINAKDFRAMAGGGWNMTRQHWSDVGISLMVTEGFGAIGMGEDIFTLLKENDGKFVILDGNKSRLILPSRNQNCMINIRRTALPLKLVDEPILTTGLAALEIGALVRVVSTQFMGKQGKVIAVDQTATRLPSGIMTYMVTIETSKQKIRIPYTNLEVIG